MPGILTHSPCEILRQLLIDLGLGTDPDLSPQQAWPVYASGEPSSPDSVITVYDTDGRDAGMRFQTTGERQEMQGFQIRVRSVDKPTGYVKAQNMAITLDEQVFSRPVTVGAYTASSVIPAGTYTVWGIVRSGSVNDLYKYVPSSKLSLHTINGVISVTQTA